MDVVDLLDRVTEVFEKQRVPFIVIGGMAVSSWVKPRATDDLDIVVRIPKRLSPLLSSTPTR